MKKIFSLFMVVALVAFILPVTGCSDSGSSGGGSNETYVTEYFTGNVNETVAYIRSISSKGEYYITIKDSTETSCEGLKNVMDSLNQYVTVSDKGSVNPSPNSDYLVSLDLSETNLKIGDNAFYDCETLSSVTLPKNITEIGSYAFENCYSLKSVTIPEGVTEIASYTFYYCTSLASVSIPDSVEKIGTYAFYRCTSLKSIEIPKSVTEIGSYAFSNCVLTSAIFDDPESWDVYSSSSSSSSANSNFKNADLSDTSLAAELLTVYIEYTWKKK